MSKPRDRASETISEKSCLAAESTGQGQTWVMRGHSGRDVLTRDETKWFSRSLPDLLFLWPSAYIEILNLFLLQFPSVMEIIILSLSRFILSFHLDCNTFAG